MIFYKSKRIGKNGKKFTLYKFRTLKEKSDLGSFSSPEQYIKYGKFLRKTKLDELPQLWNIIKGDMSLVGPRPEEERAISLLPEDIKQTILSLKPGLTDLSSLCFFNEGKILHQSNDQQRDYWTKIKPMKFVLQAFYVENKCFSLDCWILYQTFKKIIKSLF